MIFTSLSPNTEKDDIVLALKLRFLPWKRPTEEARIALEKKFADYLNISNTFAFDSGRTSLYTILSVLDLVPSDEILLQAYTCVAVPEPILWVGAKPVYVDCTKDLTMDPKDLEKKITANSKVLIIQHTLGLPAQIDELMAIAKKYNLFVIEDCAHALGAEYKHKKVGTFADASFFSFGRDKVVSSVFGGILAVKDPVRAQMIRARYTTMPEPSQHWVNRQLNHPLIFAVAKKTYSLFGLGKIIIELSKRLHLFSKAVEAVELAGGRPSFAFKKMSPTLAALALNQFSKLERFTTHRHMIATIYDQELKSTTFETPVHYADRKNGYLRYTVFTPDAKNVMSRAKHQGIMLGDWYTESIAPKHVDYKAIKYNPELCPTAEKLSTQSINLPTHIQISKEDAHRIAHVIKTIN